jgi:uncharacterized protein YcsI (UPF0317 family)
MTFVLSGQRTLWPSFSGAVSLSNIYSSTPACPCVTSSKASTVRFSSRNRRCVPAGRFSGPLVVSMRPIPPALIPLAVTITAAHPEVHGAPVHIGSPAALGIMNVNVPDWGDRVQFESDDIPVFWACGVTPQQVALESKIDLMITHAAGHMFVTKRRLRPPWVGAALVLKACWRSGS